MNQEEADQEDVAGEVCQEVDSTCEVMRSEKEARWWKSKSDDI